MRDRRRSAGHRRYADRCEPTAGGVPGEGVGEHRGHGAGRPEGPNQNGEERLQGVLVGQVRLSGRLDLPVVRS